MRPCSSIDVINERLELVGKVGQSFSLWVRPYSFFHCPKCPMKLVINSSKFYICKTGVQHNVRTSVPTHLCWCYLNIP